MKKLSALIALIIASTLLFSCNSTVVSENNFDHTDTETRDETTANKIEEMTPSTQETTNTVITPYGCEDRFIGAWYWDGEDEDADSVAFLFLSNGTCMYMHYDTKQSKWYKELGNSGSEWYTDSGNVLLFRGTIFEYTFIDDNTLVLTNGGESQQLTRISEHFANFAYGD